MKVFRLKKASAALLTGLSLFIFSGSFFGQNMFRKVNDFDGDGKADYAVTRDIGGYKYWYIWQSTGGFRVSQFGLASDENNSGDYDGDGKYDVAVYRKVPTSPNGTANYVHFWVQGSQSGVYAAMPYANIAPNQSYSVSQDYDGDGRTDFAWTTGPNGNRMAISFAVPVGNRIGDSANISDLFYLTKMGDMSGDGKADVIGQNPYDYSTLIRTYVLGSSTGAERLVQFATAGDQLVAGDFDGDGKGDLTVYRQSNGTWHTIRSSDNALQTVQFGAPGDVPVAADYDGDGKTDLAIWRTGRYDSVYWVYGSMGNIWAMQFGLPSDTVVTY